MKDEFEKNVCKNEKQLINKINNGATIVMCYNFEVSPQIVDIIKEKKIKIIAINRPIKKRGKIKGVRTNDNKTVKRDE